MVSKPVGFSLEVNQSYSQQVSGGSGGAKVRSVYRREIESHNLVIPSHWLSLQEVLGEGKIRSSCDCELQWMVDTGLSKWTWLAVNHTIYKVTKTVYKLQK